MGSSYAQDVDQTSKPQPLKVQGAQMASVPVQVGQNEIQVYQAGYDNSVPTNLHGGDIGNIEFYLTNHEKLGPKMDGRCYRGIEDKPQPGPMHHFFAPQ